MTNARRLGLWAIGVWLVCCPDVSAQDGRRVFAGVVAGASALSPDSAAVTDPPRAAVSLYAPEIGPAVNAFVGLHLTHYLSLQANYVWNRNDLRLVAASTTAGTYEQLRDSGQQAFVADVLLYFRSRESRFRPYLGTGLAVVRFASTERSATSSGIEMPASTLASTHLGLRSHVGIDITMTSRVRFRYSFSETISGNPVSPHLTPPGSRNLANFQNLFGFVAEF